MPDDTGANAAMNRYAAGDDDAFQSIYLAVAPGLYSYLRRQTRDADLARDLLQQTFLQVHRGRDSFMPGAEAGAWIVAIARRVLIDCKRRERLRHTSLEPRSATEAHDDAEQLLHAEELAERVEHTLRRIPPSQRVAFELVRRKGLSLHQAANELGTSTAAVKQRTHRAALALRRALSA